MPKSDRVNTYEAMFLLGPIAQTEQDAGVGLCRGVIERHGGQILFIKKWDERKLAYEVEGQKRGTYIIAFFKAAGSAVTHIERDVRLSEDLLRVLVTRADHLNQQEMEAVEPQPIQQREERSDRPWERNDRPDRGDRGDRGDRFERRPRAPREEGPAAAVDAGADKE